MQTCTSLHVRIAKVYDFHVPSLKHGMEWVGVELASFSCFGWHSYRKDCSREGIEDILTFSV